MVGIDVLYKLVLLPPPSKLITVISVINIVTLVNGGIAESRGKHMQYSKLITMNKGLPRKHSQTTKVIDSKVGMVVSYTPAALFSLASLFLFHDQSLRLFLLRLALSIHFLKRVFEVLFVHKYGGSGMALDATITISLSYFIAVMLMIYTQHLSIGFPEPSIDLQYIGVGLFLLGIGGNFYHHYILSTLRKEGDKEYKIPKGGLFDLVICPHYLFEVLGFVGVSCISQTLYALSFTIGSASYLLGRSYATRKWYLSKLENFPRDVKCMIPFIF